MSSRPSVLFALFALAALSASAPPALAQGEGPPVLPPPAFAGSPPAGAAADDATVEEIAVPEETAVAVGGTVDELLVAEAEAVLTLLEPGFWLDPIPWDVGVEFGLNGSEGNNNVLSLRAGGFVRRKTKRWKLDSSLQYNKNHTNGVETQNNGKLDVRLDRILDESPWSLFIVENMIYDEFQAFDIQLSLNSGIGYQFIDNEKIDLLGRIGVGTTREFGNVDPTWEPQSLFGFDYTHQLTKLQKLVAKTDYMPEWQDYRDYRVVSDVGWQIDLDRPKNVSLKLSLVNRYDSTPDGAAPNNLDYAVLLIWSL